MKLYYSVPSSSSRRLLVTLALKKIICEGERVILGDEGSMAAHRRRTPMGQVPVLEIDGVDGPTFLSQSVAIAEYLDEVVPHPPLLGTAATERARVREVVGLVSSGIQPLHNMATLAEVRRTGGDDEVARWTRHFIARGLDALESFAGRSDGPFVVTDHPTLADVYVAAQIHLVRAWKVLDLGPYPSLRRVEAQCGRLEAFSDPPLPQEGLSPGPLLT